MKRLYCKFLFALVLMIGLNACSSEIDQVDDIDAGYDYYPLELGREWVYQSDSIIVLRSGTMRDTLISQIREVVVDTLRNLEGNLLYKLDRFIDKSGNGVWKRMNSWYVLKDHTKVVRTEENIPIVKLVFPLTEGLKFRSNLFLNDEIKSEVGGEFIEVYEGWYPQVNSLKASVPFQNETLSVAQIQVANIDEFIDLRQVIEYYAKGIGLVRKEMTIYDTDGNNPDNPWDLKAKKGFKHTLQLISYK